MGLVLVLASVLALAPVWGPGPGRELASVLAPVLGRVPVLERVPVLGRVPVRAWHSHQSAG